MKVELLIFIFITEGNILTSIHHIYIYISLKYEKKFTIGKICYR